MAFPHLTRRPQDLCAAAAAGLAVGGFVTSAPLLAGPTGMPGEAIRYLLLTGLLLAAVVAAVHRRTVRDRSTGATAAARRAVVACLLAGAAALSASPLVFATLLVGAAALGGGSLSLYRPRHSWHAACLVGASAAATTTALSAQHPQVACALVSGLAALLLVPACLGPAQAGDARTSVALWTAGGVGAAVFGTVFAGQGLVVFRWELLGGSGAQPFAYAALLAAILTSGLAVAGRHWPPGGAGPHVPLLFAAGLTAAVAACAGAARPWQFVPALATVLTCGAAGVAALDTDHEVAAGHAHHGPALLFGGVAAVTGIALSGRLLGNADTLTAIGLAPAMAAVAALALGRHRAGTQPDDAGGAGTAGASLTVDGLVVRGPGTPTLRRLDLTLCPGEITYLADAIPGRRAGSVLAVLAGLRKADGGTWRLRGHDISRIDARTRWDLRLSAFVDPVDGARMGALHDGHPAGSVSDAVSAATAHLGRDQSAQLLEAARTTFPFLAAKSADPCGQLGPDERCFLGLVQSLIAQPALLLLDLTGPGCGPLAADPGVRTVLGHIADRGTTVLVAVPAAQAIPGQPPIILPAPGDSRTTRRRRNREAKP